MSDEKKREVRPPNGLKKIANLFDPEEYKDIVNDAAANALNEAIDAVASTLSRFVDSLFYDEDDVPDRSTRSGRKGRDYSAISTKKSGKSSDKGKGNVNDMDAHRKNDWGPYDIGDVPFETRAKAEDVIAHLISFKKRNPDEPVTTSNFYQEACVITSNWKVFDFGWTELEPLQRAHPVKSGKFWYIKIARPEEL